MANFCENCGSPLQNDNRFCPNCGAPVNQSVPDAPPASAAAAPARGGSAAAAATTASATVVGAAAAAQERTQGPFVPPQPQQEPPQRAMQQPQEPAHQRFVDQNAQQPPLQSRYGPQNPGQSAFDQHTGQEVPPSGRMPMGTPAYGSTGPKYEPDTDLQSMYLRYDNRLNRKRYILRALALWAAVMVVSILIGFIASALKIKALSMLGTIISIASAIPGFMLVIRRLHDLDRPTWWCIGCIIPIVNFALAIYLLFFKGTDGPNQYGPDPLEVQD